MTVAVELSIVIPAYNEVARLPATLDALEAHLAPYGSRAEVLVVDDGSTDGTSEVVTERPITALRLSRIRMPRNRGKGKAVVMGVEASKGEVVAFIDADLPYTLANLDQAVRLIRDGEADVALGARDLPSSTYDPSYPIARQIAGRTYAALMRVALGVPFGDTQCGLKGFRADAARQLFRPITINGYGFDVELVYLACTRGYRIVRFPVTLSHRHESRVRLVRDSLRMFGDLWRIRRNESRKLYGPRPAVGPVRVAIAR